MLTVKKLGLAQASTYYSKDNYYTQQVGEYFGKLKSELGLDDLTHDSFQQLLRGINPSTGENLVSAPKVPAFDFTFSPEKSISIAYELAVFKGDEKLANLLISAHDNAVNSSLSYLQDKEIKTRIQKNGVRKSVNTGKLIAAKFQHDINRDLAPQLHTHSVIFNMTQGEDGKFRSLDVSKMLAKGSPIIKNIGKYYRENLKEELLKVGFELRVTDKDRSFYELKHINDDLVQAFSSRTIEIRKRKKELKKEFPYLSDSQIDSRAFYNTRTTKKDVDRDAVRVENLKLIDKISISNSDKLLEKLNSFEKKEIVKVNDKEIFRLVREAKKELNKWNKTPLNIASGVVTRLPVNGNIPIKELVVKIQNKELKDKESLITMHEVVIINLKQTKLDTKKLYSSLYSLKNIDKYKLEEALEDARGRTRRRSDGITIIGINDTQSVTASRAKQAHDRDDVNANRQVDTTRDERERGDESKGHDDVKYRNDTAITRQDIAMAERGGREWQEKIKQNKGIEQ